GAPDPDLAARTLARPRLAPPCGRLDLGRRTRRPARPLVEPGRGARRRAGVLRAALLARRARFRAAAARDGDRRDDRASAHVLLALADPLRRRADREDRAAPDGDRARGGQPAADDAEARRCRAERPGAAAADYRRRSAAPARRRARRRAPDDPPPAAPR